MTTLVASSIGDGGVTILVAAQSIFGRFLFQQKSVFQLLSSNANILGCIDPRSSGKLLQARIKKEMTAANKKQMELKAAAQAAAAAEEERMKQAMLAKFAEDDRLEQMNAQKRRMRGLEHRKEVHCPCRPLFAVFLLCHTHY